MPHHTATHPYWAYCYASQVQPTLGAPHPVAKVVGGLFSFELSGLLGAFLRCLLGASGPSFGTSGVSAGPAIVLDEFCEDWVPNVCVLAHFLLVRSNQVHVSNHGILTGARKVFYKIGVD